MKNVLLLALAAAGLMVGMCHAQTLHSYVPYGYVATQAKPSTSNYYFCPKGVAPEIATAKYPNVYIPGITVYANDPSFSVAKISAHPCLDLSEEAGVVALIMHREKLHAEMAAVITAQTAATEKLVALMETWMKKAEQDLRAAVDGKFKTLPEELVNSSAHTASLDKLRSEIMQKVNCRLDADTCK